MYFNYLGFALMKNYFLLCFVLFLIFPIKFSYAGDSYAFVRFVQLNDHYIETEIEGKYYGVVGEGEASPYHKIAIGNITIRAGESILKGPIHKNKFYSLVVSGHKEIFLEDFPNKEKGKAQLSLYNFIDGSVLNLNVKVKEEYVPVVVDVLPDHVGFRGLNSMDAKLRIFSGEEKIGEDFDVILKKGKTYSVFATSEDVFVSENLYK